MRLLFISIFVAFFTLLNAATVIGSVENTKGTVKVKSEGSFKKSKVKKGSEIKEGDLVITSKRASAVIKLSDGSTVILDASSSIHFPSIKNAEQKSGKIFYKITSRDAKNSLKIKTPFAIIGIKGTTFIVNTNKGKEAVALKEGLIGIASIKEQFALYRKDVMAKYNNYVNDQMSEFEKYKRGQQEPKPEMTKEFDLKQGNIVSFSANKVKETAWAENNDKDFAAFEKQMMDISKASKAK